MKRFIYKTLCALFAVLICLLPLPFLGCGNSKYVSLRDGVEVEKREEVKNVILLIGDGMGFNHIENTKKYFNLPMQPFETNQMQSKTYSKSDAVTDSAAGATALACGRKVNNGSIAKDGEEKLVSIMALAKQQGKKTGIITSDNLYGATPASFSSHANSRYDTADIMEGQLESGVDLLIGKYSSSYSYASRYGQEFTEKGYTLASDASELPEQNDKKVLAELPSIKSIYNENEANQTELKTLVEYSLNYLNNENGFVLMIESAYIDKFSHNNDFYGAMCEVRAFFDTIQVVYDYCQAHTDTIFMVTADHETGGLALGENNFDNSLYSTGSHTGVNVPFYWGGFKLNKKEGVINNISVFDICKYYTV